LSVAATDLVERTREGFQVVKVRDEIKESALKHLADWLGSRKFAGLTAGQPDNYRPLLEWMVTSGKFELLLDSFYQVMPFGTGGRRGPVGIGPNRINPYTMASSVEGHVQYLRQRFPKQADLKVVVAYDVRKFADLRQLYPADVPNPVLGLSSKDFAHIATSVYCAGGVTVYLLPDELNDFISTPELSFLIGRFDAHGGLNVSASHNHPDDNGGKFYNDRGGQEIPPYDEQMVKIVETITAVRGMPYEEARSSGQVREITAEDRQAYIELNLNLRLRKTAGPAKIVFTPLHGTGSNTVGRCLQAMGFAEGKQFFTVASQREFRGDFANVKFRTPNPEVPESLEAASAEAQQRGADLVLATDPDADRIGATAARPPRY
jgi:phosphoglucomutase/phosphomannomutase